MAMVNWFALINCNLSYYGQSQVDQSSQHSCTECAHSVQFVTGRLQCEAVHAGLLSTIT